MSSERKGRNGFEIRVVSITVNLVYLRYARLTN